MAIHFHTEEISFKLSNKQRLKNWIKNCMLQENKTPGNINYIFCSDDYLLEINKAELKHNYYTDIITFDLSENASNKIDADLFISIDRVKNNALDLKTDFESELHRVMIHGILHLLGWSDKSAKEKQKMRKEEDKQLKIL